jgi:glycerol-1-phosphate dehydrogenase [NAD(P)+]
MEFPQLFVYDESDREEDAAGELVTRIESLGVGAPFVVTSIHGKGLAAELAGTEAHETPAAGADQHWASGLGSRAHRAGADAVVAIGGGRCLDVAKLAAARSGLPLIAVPTQLSHDGICSPVAVVPGDDGRAESLGAIAPRAVFVSLPTLAGSPRASSAAGLGDLLANPLALRDWSLAAERGLEELDQRAWDLSAESTELIRPYLDADPEQSAKDPMFLRRLADALILSGMAMILSGTSRPASGAEHEISHAIDACYGGRALHGAQVAFGCIISMELYTEDTAGFRRQLATLGLPRHPAELNLTEDDLVRLLLEAPDTRPGRFTVLEDADLDAEAARALVRRIWSSAPPRK